jgi:hypothetical protein
MPVSLKRGDARGNEAEVLTFQYLCTVCQVRVHFVPQGLTVLLSYEIVAYVPLLGPWVRGKMASVRTQAILEIAV